MVLGRVKDFCPADERGSYVFVRYYSPTARWPEPQIGKDDNGYGNGWIKFHADHKFNKRVAKISVILREMDCKDGMCSYEDADAKEFDNPRVG